MRLFGWVMFRLVNDRREVRLGKYKERLIRPPIVRPPIPDKYLKSHRMDRVSVSFKLESFDYNKDSLPYFLERKQKENQTKYKFKIVKTVEFKPNEDPFIVNRKRQFKDREFLKGNGIDIYVDSARFLPDNTGPCKVIMRVVNADNEDFLKVYQVGLPHIDSDIFNPVFEFRHELRAPQYGRDLVAVFFLVSWDNKDSLIRDASGILREQEDLFTESTHKDETTNKRGKSFMESQLRSRISRVNMAETFDQSVLINQFRNLEQSQGQQAEPLKNNQVDEELEIIDDLLVELDDCPMRVVGFSALSLFASPDELNQRNKDRQFLRNGLYQLPIFCQRPRGFRPEDLKSLDRFPCSSLLVRVYQAPVSQNALKVLSITEENPKEWEKYGLWQKMVPYQSGLFNNQTITLSDNEKELFAIRKDRPALPIKFYMNHFMQTNAEQLLPDGGAEYQSEDIKFTDDQVIHFLDKFIGIRRLDDIWKLDRIDLKFFNKYQSSAGIKFSLDTIGNFDTGKGFPFVVSWLLHSRFSDSEFALDTSLMSLKDKHTNYLDAFLQRRKTVDNETQLKENLLYKSFLNRRIDWADSSTRLVTFNEDYIKLNNLESNPRAFILFGGANQRSTESAGKCSTT